MAVIAVREIMDRRRGGVDAQRHRTYERAFRVEFDSPLHGVIDCERALFFYYQIQRFSPYIDANGVYDRGALAEAVDCTPEDPEGCFNWIAVVTYSSRIWDDYLKALQSGGTGKSGNSPSSPSQNNNDASSPENPLNRPATIRTSPQPIKRVLDLDRSGGLVGSFRTGIAVTNSAGDKFDPPVEVDESHTLITVTRNEATLDIPYPRDSGGAFARGYEDTVNMDTFRLYVWSFIPGSIRVVGIETESVFEDPWSYFRVTYQFLTRRPRRSGQIVNAANSPGPEIQGWDIDLLDQGRRELVVASGSMQNNFDKYGLPAASDIPLDGAGRALSQAQISLGGFKFRAFRPYEPVLYAPLLMPFVP